MRELVVTQVLEAVLEVLEAQEQEGLAERLVSEALGALEASADLVDKVEQLASAVLQELGDLLVSAVLLALEALAVVNANVGMTTTVETTTL